MPLSDTAPSDWHYVSEGGATIVFSYGGPPHPILDGMVLRLRKRAHKVEPGDGPAPAELNDPMVDFQHIVIERLINPTYLVKFQVVPITESWLRIFSSHHELNRPMERKKVDGIDLSKRNAVLATDLVGSQLCSVEIKPKWGFLPSPAHLSPESLPIKTQTCRTCMHNHLRQIDDRHAAVDYCPLDLFSGSEERTRRAISGLFLSWQKSFGCVNNLRIFYKGKLLTPNNDVLGWSQEILGCSAHATLPEIQEAFTERLLPLLLVSPLLRNISLLQRKLDALDSEGLAKLRDRAQQAHRNQKREDSAGLLPPMNAAPVHIAFETWSSTVPGDDGDISRALEAESMEPTLPEWASFVDNFLSSSHSRNHANLDPADLRYYTLAYLLSATFKDCSVIVPISTVPTSSSASVMRVIDLDTKPVKKLRQWEDLDKKIVEAYATVDETSRRLCLDAGYGQTLKASRDTRSQESPEDDRLPWAIPQPPVW